MGSNCTVVIEGKSTWMKEQFFGGKIALITIAFSIATCNFPVATHFFLPNCTLIHEITGQNSIYGRVDQLNYSGFKQLAGKPCALSNTYGHSYACKYFPYLH